MNLNTSIQSNSDRGRFATSRCRPNCWIKAVFDVIGPYIGMSLEQFEIGFMRDMHPESEVALWCSITAAWLAYHEKFLGDETLPHEHERNMLGALIAISTGVEDVAKLNVPVEVGRRLIQCYDDLRKE